MKSFNVYHHYNLSKFAAVKNGYSWTGFFFGLFWMVWNRLFLQAGILLLALFCLSLLQELIYLTEGYNASVSFNIINLGIMIFIGYRGNEWKRINLVKRGYNLALENVQTDNKDLAISAVSK